MIDKTLLTDVMKNFRKNSQNELVYNDGKILGIMYYDSTLKLYTLKIVTKLSNVVEKYKEEKIALHSEFEPSFTLASLIVLTYKSLV